MPRARRATIAAPVLAVALAVAGCSSTTTPTPDPTPTTTSGANDVGAAQPTPGASPTWDSGSAAAAGAAADGATGAFVRKDLPYDAWFAQLSPHLSAAAQDAYRDTDPANVPGTRRAAGTTPGTTSSVGGSAYLATVPVLTDAGVYTVHLSRIGAGAPWLVDHFDLPPGTDG